MATTVGEQKGISSDVCSSSFVEEVLVESPATARRAARSREVVTGPVVTVEELQMTECETGVEYDLDSKRKTGEEGSQSVFSEILTKVKTQKSETGTDAKREKLETVDQGSQTSIFSDILTKVKTQKHETGIDSKREQLETGVLPDIDSKTGEEWSKTSVFSDILTKVKTQKSESGVLYSIAQKPGKSHEDNFSHSSRQSKLESGLKSAVVTRSAITELDDQASKPDSKNYHNKTFMQSNHTESFTELKEQKSKPSSQQNVKTRRDSDIEILAEVEDKRSKPTSQSSVKTYKHSDIETITEVHGQRSTSQRNVQTSKHSDIETITELEGQRSKPTSQHNVKTSKHSDIETVVEVEGQRSKSESSHKTKRSMQSEDIEVAPETNIHVIYSSDSTKQSTAAILYDILASGNTTTTQVEVHVADVQNTAVLTEYKRQVFSRGTHQGRANILLLLSHWDSFEKKCIEDGPISVQDPVDINMFSQSQDAAGSQSASKTLSSASNQSLDQQRLDKVSTNQNANQVNGSVLLEDRKNLKHLPIEEVLEKVKVIVNDLDKFVEFNRAEVMQLQKCLGDFYWDYSSHRKEIGDAIAEAGYAAITVRILKGLNTIGIFKNDDVWFPTYYTYNTTWNYSDCSELLAKNLAEADAVRLLTLNCGHKPYLSAVHSKNVYYVIKASMSILHNIARNPTAKSFFKENKTSEVIMPFITMNDDMLKVLAMLTLAYIVEEEDNTKLIDETGTIKNIVLWIEKALENQKRRFKGFTPMELTQGLDKLAVNDGNKSRIIEEGAISLFMKMLLHDDPREHVVTARCIWTLSFDKGVRQKLVDHENLVSTLEKLTASSDKEVHKNASGALWILKGEIDPTNDRPKSAAKTKNHIFISYSWSDQQQAKEILTKLKSEGYSVWIDIEQMGGSTLEAMAGAIENSAVVLVCMSEKYKQSPNCRTEAEYTFQLRKDYIPLMMQRKYRPDGWLGLILGAKLFFDFSGKYPFEKSMSGLLKELRGRGQRGPMSEAPSVVFCSMEDIWDDHFDISCDISGGNITSRAFFFLDCHALFNQFDGRLIWQLKQMKNEAPDYFYQCLEKRLNMGLIDMLKLSAALDQMQ